MGDNRGPQLRAVQCFFLAFSWIFVLLRCYCRIIVVKSFGLDDILCLIAQILFTFFCSFSLTGVYYGAGQHLADIQPPSHIPLSLQWWWACEPIYVLCNMVLKFSIGVFLLRICVSKVQRAVVWTVMTVSGILCTYFFFIFIFQCWPVSYFWKQYDGSGMQGSCIDGNIVTASMYAYSAMSVFSDWTYCILPIFMVWKLQMNPRAKISVCIILGVFSIASAATIIRIPYIGGLKVGSDFLYAATDVSIWSITETGLAISACAAATLRPLFRSLTDSLVTGNSLGGTYAHGTHKRDTQWPVRPGYTRNGSRNGKEDMGVRTDIVAHAVGGNDGDAIYLTKWPEDGQSSGAEADGVSMSSQTKLKMDEETGLTAVQLLSGIKKTVVVSTNSVRV